jgi:hypothetical protein
VNGLSRLVRLHLEGFIDTFADNAPPKVDTGFTFRRKVRWKRLEASPSPDTTWPGVWRFRGSRMQESNRNPDLFPDAAHPYKPATKPLKGDLGCQLIEELRLSQQLDRNDWLEQPNEQFGSRLERTRPNTVVPNEA